MVVSAADRGNYPLVHFETPDGQTRDWFPSVAAVKGSEHLYGREAVAVQGDEDWTFFRSLKRLLRAAGPHTELRVGAQTLPLRLLMAEMMVSLRTLLLHQSNLGADPAEPLEVMIGVPANANSNQRFLTEEAAQEAGFTVLGVVNEPSAAAIEFAYRNSAERKNRAGSSLLVYDLGGAPSTFPWSRSAKPSTRSKPPTESPTSAATTSTKSSPIWLSNSLRQAPLSQHSNAACCWKSAAKRKSPSIPTPAKSPSISSACAPRGNR